MIFLQYIAEKYYSVSFLTDKNIYVCFDSWQAVDGSWLTIMGDDGKLRTLRKGDLKFFEIARY